MPSNVVLIGSGEGLGEGLGDVVGLGGTPLGLPEGRAGGVGVAAAGPELEPSSSPSCHAATIPTATTSTATTTPNGTFGRAA